jgi:hypothetical protein
MKAEPFVSTRASPSHGRRNIGNLIFRLPTGRNITALTGSPAATRNVGTERASAVIAEADESRLPVLAAFAHLENLASVKILEKSVLFPNAAVAFPATGEPKYSFRDMTNQKPLFSIK